jgi:hypothetical protein
VQLPDLDDVRNQASMDTSTGVPGTQAFSTTASVSGPMLIIPSGPLESRYPAAAGWIGGLRILQRWFSPTLARRTRLCIWSGDCVGRPRKST